MRFAFETAQKRPKKHITVVTKSNAQRNGMVMWDEIANEVKQEFPDVQMDKMLVDAMTCRMVLQPQSLDTIVATNLVSLTPSSPLDTHTNTRASTPTSSQTLPPHSQAQSASRRHPTSTRQGRTRACSSRSMALPSTLLGKALRTPSGLSGPRRR